MGKKYLITFDEISYLRSLPEIGCNNPKWLEAHEYREQTCRNEVDEYCQFKCSNCGSEFNSGCVYSFEYCPSCGAKIVEE